ncbi:MAG: M48 family metallopeptidase [Patescibacteria group bacterium]
MYKAISANRFRTILLMAIFFAVIVGIGWILANVYDDPAMLGIAVVISVAMNWISYFRSDKIALTTAKARPVDVRDLTEHKIQNLVENLSITAGVPAPQVYIIDDPSMNAFATGRNPAHASIALTRGLIETLDKTEIEGVIAHELSHVKNYDILLATVVVTLVGTITLLADWFTRSRWIASSNDNDNGGTNILAAVGLVLIVLSPIFVTLLQLAVSRKRELLADASGAMLTRYPEGLARALEKISAKPQTLKSANRATAHLFIVSPFASKVRASIANLWSTHPPIEQRIKLLRGMGA